MNLLLDTHILLWAILDDSRLSKTARRFIEDAGNKVYFSVISPWKVQIKHQLHPDDLTLDGKQLAAFCREAGYLALPLKLPHIYKLASLERNPGAPEHRDPFDRMLVCQASVEEMILLTHDKRIGEYTDPCVLMV